MNKLHLLTPLKVAEELLLIDSCALRKVRPEELEGESWLGERKVELSPNITNMVDHFNSLAQLVPTEILAETTAKMRAKVISSFIKVAKACYNLKNYHSLKAVLAGLQCTPVYRLKKTWKKVHLSRKKIFNVLSSLMAEEGNCMLYHKEIHNNLKNRVPFVPYLGFFLTQVVHQRCYQNMCKQGMRRKGAILKRYKILTPTIRPCKEYNSSFCCPNGDNLHFYNPVGWSTPQSQVIPDISYSYDDASDAYNINDGDSFGHEVCQFDKRCASLLHLNLIRGAFTTNSLSGSLHAPSEHSTSSSTHSCVGLSYRSIESLDLCGPKHETQYSRSVSHKMSASLCSLGPEHEMNIQLAGSHSDTPLHQGEDCDTSNIDEYNHLLGLSYLMSDSSSVSLSPSPAHSRCSLPGTGTSADDEPSSSWYGDYRFHSAKSSGATNSVKEDNSPSTSICHLRDCSIANDIDNDKVPSSIIQYHMVTSEDTPYEERGSPPCVSPPAIASGDMWDSNSPDYARLGVCLERRRHAIHADFRDTKDPKVLLMMYQMSSLDCSIEIKERVSIGNIMTDYCFNTEAENYELSYQREPKCTRREISKEPSDLSNTPLDRTRTEKVQETKQN